MVREQTLMNDRQLLEHHAIFPKKSLGQNFLHDPNLLEKIAEIADLTPQTTVLEVGPGTGNLTRVLAQQAGRVIAVEIDDRLMMLLEREFADHPRVKLALADILEVNLRELVGDDPYIVVANLPYYITSAILRYFLEASHKPMRLVVTVQYEVAERLVAEPGDMSLLAVSAQFYGHPQIMLRLNPAVFWPRPEVDSAVVRLDVYDQPPIAVPGEKQFFRIVRAGFGQKRKQLRNSISAGLHLDKSQADQLLIQAGVDPQRRAETLSLDEWAAITRMAADQGLV